MLCISYDEDSIYEIAPWFTVFTSRISFPSLQSRGSTSITIVLCHIDDLLRLVRSTILKTAKGPFHLDHLPTLLAKLSLIIRTSEDTESG
jgi:hypothetical protein